MEQHAFPAENEYERRHVESHRTYHMFHSRDDRSPEAGTSAPAKAASRETTR